MNVHTCAEVAQMFSIYCKARLVKKSFKITLQQTATEEKHNQLYIIVVLWVWTLAYKTKAQLVSGFPTVTSCDSLLCGA